MENAEYREIKLQEIEMGMSEMLQSRVSWVRQFTHTALLQVVPRVDVETNQEVATERPKS